jgi:hypothetical protein
MLKSESAEEGTRVTQVVPRPRHALVEQADLVVGVRPRVDAVDHEREPRRSL